MYNLEGKVALVTGAGGEYGIGRAIATRLAQEGADVVVTELQPPPEKSGGGWGGLPAVVAEIEALGRRALGLYGDVSNAAQVDKMVRQTLEVFGQIDILINNAGAPAGRDRVPVIELEEDAWDLIQRVNVKGTFLCCQAVARAMIERGRGGRIINMSSTSGKKGVARFAAYCASKFAVRGFTQSLALELGPHHITVNALCPGLIITERTDDMAAALKPEEISADAYRQQMIDSYTAGSPLERVGNGADVARIAAFLASDEADYMTGLSLNVAGGFMMD